MRHLTVQVLLWAAIAVFAAAAWPHAFGGKVNYTIVAGQSMEPTYVTGDLLIGWRSGTYQAGDVVVFTVPDGEHGAGGQVVHRIISGDPTAWTLRGDNNDHDDMWHPSSRDIVSGVAVRIPKLGLIVHYARHPLLIAALGGPVVGYILWPSGGSDPTDDPAVTDEVAAGTPPPRPWCASRIPSHG